METAPLRGGRATGKRDKLAGIHDADRVERLFDAAQDRQRGRIAEPGEFIALHLADSVLGTDRTAPLRYEFMDRGAHCLSVSFLPFARLRPVGCAEVEVDVPVSQVAECDGFRSCESAFQRLASFDDEVRHPFDRYGNVVLHRWAVRALCRRNAVAQCPKSFGLRFAGRDRGVGKKTLVQRCGEKSGSAVLQRGGLRVMGNHFEQGVPLMG